MWQRILTDEYLTETHLSGLSSYKYSAKDTSPLSIYVMHPFWNHVVEYFPRWIAPNVMTFVGFLFTALNFVLLSYYDWSFTASTGNEGTTPIPNWVWLCAAFNIFAAYTLDGIDGKQARRIGLSGPLGELFDHGLDSYTAILIPGCLYSLFGRYDSSIPPIRMYYIMWMVFFNFYISHWEKYNTGVLYLPWGYDFSMWGSTLLYLTTWLGTYEIWKRSLPFGIAPGLAMEFILHISCLSSLPMVVYNVYMSYKEKTGKLRTPIEAARPLISFFFFLGLFLYWAFKSPNNIIETDTRIVYLLSGTLFSNISCRLIVAQMSSTRCEAFHWMTPLFCGSVLISLYVPILERPLLYLLCIFTTLAHWHYGTKVYSAKDTSPLSIYVMHPFWNHVVEYFPRWIAPNVMTFVGFLFTALNFVLLSYYDWSFTASTGNEGTTPIPNWVWLCAAFNIFAAYTLDGIDGKQARRIGLSGPLGELFDHGLDSYTAILIPGCLYSLFGRYDSSIPPIRMYYIMWMVFFNFYISHWEKYNTGVLYLPWGYDFSMWGSTLLYLTTWLGTYEIWKRSLPFGIAPGLAMEFILHISCLSSLPMVVYNVYMSYKEKTGKLRTPIEAARPLISFFFFLGLFLYWAFKSPNNIIETDTRIVYLLSGTLFSNISCRLIVAQMSSTRCEAFHWMTPLFCGSVLISLYVPILERPLLYLLCIFTTLAHWHYGTKVVQQMCLHFNRICFSVNLRTPTKKLS